MTYQENKVFNLKLAAKKLNGLLIRPGETFSFWRLVRHADKHIPYKDGLTVTHGKLTCKICYPLPENVAIKEAKNL